jgi:hypothetical protein
MGYLNAQYTGIVVLLLAFTIVDDRSYAKSPADASPPEWHVLFDGKGLSAWRGWSARGIPRGWHVREAMLTKDGPVEDLVTRRQFRNFELELEWKIGEGGNSGIFYRGTREYDHIYWSAPEYQLLDDANARDGRNPLTSAAAAYGIYAPAAKLLQAFDEWNTTRILVNAAHVEHWLNGAKVLEYELWGPDWRARVAASKFAAYPHYGLARRGYIGIQGDHTGTLAVRNVRIRELP